MGIVCRSAGERSRDLLARVVKCASVDPAQRPTGEHRHHPDAMPGAHQRNRGKSTDPVTLEPETVRKSEEFEIAMDDQSPPLGERTADATRPDREAPEGTIES